MRLLGVPEEQIDVWREAFDPEPDEDEEFVIHPGNVDVIHVFGEAFWEVIVGAGGAARHGVRPTEIEAIARMQRVTPAKRPWVLEGVQIMVREVLAHEQ